MKKKIDVQLLGKTFTVRSNKDASYINKVANFVTRRFEEIRRKAPTLTQEELGLLVALNISDDLMSNQAEALEKVNALEVRLEKMVASLSGSTANAASLADDIRGNATQSAPVLRSPTRVGSDVDVVLDAEKNNRVHQQEFVMVSEH